MQHITSRQFYLKDAKSLAHPWSYPREALERKANLSPKLKDMRGSNERFVLLLQRPRLGTRSHLARSISEEREEFGHTLLVLKAHDVAQNNRPFLS
jgi:hypothetical protein